MNQEQKALFKNISSSTSREVNFIFRTYRVKFYFRFTAPYLFHFINAASNKLTKDVFPKTFRQRRIRLRSKQSRILCKRSLKQHQTNPTSENRSHFQNMSQLGIRSCFRSQPDITSAAMFYSPQTMQNGSGQHFVPVCTTWIPLRKKIFVTSKQS